MNGEASGGAPRTAGIDSPDRFRTFLVVSNESHNIRVVARCIAAKPTPPSRVQIISNQRSNRIESNRIPRYYYLHSHPRNNHAAPDQGIALDRRARDPRRPHRHPEIVRRPHGRLRHRQGFPPRGTVPPPQARTPVPPPPPRRSRGGGGGRRRRRLSRAEVDAAPRRTRPLGRLGPRAGSAADHRGSVLHRRPGHSHDPARPVARGLPAGGPVLRRQVQSRPRHRAHPHEPRVQLRLRVEGRDRARAADLPDAARGRAAPRDHIRQPVQGTGTRHRRRLPWRAHGHVRQRGRGPEVRVGEQEDTIDHAHHHRRFRQPVPTV
jgi:hypothetical protein